ncbi:hypothetical protein ON010_g18678 [Phytophthora cinnamomi]|nr:hypothetical protein ON010_g18678 [Phytophthora cinnamomi]
MRTCLVPSDTKVYNIYFEVGDIITAFVGIHGAREFLGRVVGSDRVDDAPDGADLAAERLLRGARVGTRDTLPLDPGASSWSSRCSS